MIVNKNRLDILIDYALETCDYCPLQNTKFCAIKEDSGEMNMYNCENAVLDWLQEFDVAEALEAGAHIVNDRVIFPPEEIPFAAIPIEPVYGTPCEVRNERGKESLDCDECEYLFDCPYN